MNIRNTFILILFLSSCVYSQKTTLEVIATTGAPDFSVGWYKIDFTNYYGDNLIIHANSQTGFINKFAINSPEMPTIKVEPTLLNKIRKPDFSTINNLWYSSLTNKISSISFEFEELIMNEKVTSGRFIVIIAFENREVSSIDIRQYDKNGTSIYLLNLF